MKEKLERLAVELRRKIVKLCYSGGGGHISSSCSMLDIVIALYFANIIKYDPSSPQMPDRDRFILSKGHGALALYTVLSKAGYFGWEHLKTYLKPGSIFGAEPLPLIPGIETTGGSLGHGLSFAVGCALAAKLKDEYHQIYVVTGDGECQEGSLISGINNSTA
jgi:transketolase